VRPDVLFVVTIFGSSFITIGKMFFLLNLGDLNRVKIRIVKFVLFLF
jgi:hypothetical protein